MSHIYDDDQSEDGELARSPMILNQDEMDFSLSDDERDHSLVIKPPQAVVQGTHRERRHKKLNKERHKESRREKKHLYREREKAERLKSSKNSERELEKDYFAREKEYYREKDLYRERNLKEKDSYKESREKEVYREKEIKDRDSYREKELYREREHYREREQYKDNVPYREKDVIRQRESYKDKELYKEKDVYRDKDMPRERDNYLSREKERQRFIENDRKQRDLERTEGRSRGEESYNPPPFEKENLDKSSGDKELEDLRSRLLSKRISKELQNSENRKGSDVVDRDKSSRDNYLDKHQQERRNRLIEAEREIEKRKLSSREELEARREERRRRGKKRLLSPKHESNKKSKNEVELNIEETIVMVSDTSDIEMKSDSHLSEEEEGEHTGTESEGNTSSETESGSESKSEDDTKNNEDTTKFKNSEDEKVQSDKEKQKSVSPENKAEQPSPISDQSRRSRTRSRSRSHSFSPPPLGENGKSAIEEDISDEKKEENAKKISDRPSYFPALQGCRSVEEFQCLNRIEEGTYGVVYRARDKTTEEIVALKRLKMEKEKEGFPITSLREINTLLKGQHPNIVTVREIVVGSNMDKIFIVMDYVEHDLKSLMETMRAKKQVFLPGEVKCLMTQLLKAVHHLHDNWILHRDLKTSNLLLSHKGVLKVGDFGLAREYGSPLRPYTPVVVTLWYRAPELLLCCKEYSTPIDMWSVGCIFAEFVTMHALFPGKSEVDQLNRIFKDLGTPSEAIWPGYSQLPAVQKMTFAEHPAGGLRQRAGPDLLSDMGLALLQGFLTYDPQRRLAADAALQHAYFKEQPVAIEPAMFPTWPAKSEGGRRSTHSPRPPAGGAAYSRAEADDAGFHIPAASALAPHSHARSLNVAPGFSLKF